MRYAKLSPGPGRSAEEVSAHQGARIQAALIEIVAERSYSSLKVRDLVKLAGVSTRAFYEHFDSKEDCFLRTHELIARRTTRQILAAQVGEDDWRRRPRLIYKAFIKEMQRDPAAARMMLVEGSAASLVREQSRHFEEVLAKMIGESFARPPSGVAVPELVIEGMVAGIGRVARARLLAGKQEELLDIGSDLMSWALSFPGKHAEQLPDLDSQSVWRDTRLLAAGEPGTAPWDIEGDRGLIFDAIGRLSAEASANRITVTRICRAAGIQRKVFSAHFDDVEGASVAALEQRVDRALAQAARAQAAGCTWTGCTYRTITALCDEIHEDPLLIQACLDNGFTPSDSVTRTRRRLVAPIAEQLNGAPPDRRPEPLAAEASVGSIWSIIHNRVARPATSLYRPQVSATLTYLAAAPGVGAPGAVARIRREQAPPG